MKAETQRHIDDWVSAEFRDTDKRGAGWYYYATGYEEEGSEGPYATKAQAIIAGRMAVHPDGLAAAHEPETIEPKETP